MGKLANVGILGAGQLARMLALYAYGLGLRPFVFAKSPNECACDVAARVFIDDGSDRVLREFARHADILVIESEFVDLAKLSRVVGKTPLLPDFKCLKRVQNKFHQKIHMKKFDIPTLEFAEVSPKTSVEEIRDAFGDKVVLKNALMGYDGKGTYVLNLARPFDCGKMSELLAGSFEGYAEEFANFKKEISVIVARSINGEVRCFPVVESVQVNSICDHVLVPGGLPKNVESKAKSIAEKVIRQFDGVGVFGVEMFWLKDGRIVVNEIAPRVHNTGHWTMNAALTSQFEQHWRAVLGLPLGDVAMTAKGAAMVNILGRKKTEIGKKYNVGEIGPSNCVDSNTWVHWYGKSGASLGRKLGHVNAIGMNSQKALIRAKKARERIKI